MLASILSRIIGRGRAASSSTLRRRWSSRHIAAASGQAIQALEGRVLLSVLYVDANAPGPEHDGASWETAYRDLQLALGASTAGDEIRIADGTYKPTNGTDRTISFELRDGVAIRGGYAGHGAADPDERDIALYRTILSGDIGTSSRNDNSYRVVRADGVGAATVIDGLTITAGNANATGNSSGAGLFATNASPTLLNCTFTGNSASNGGGMHNTSSSPTLINCIFTGNAAGNGGGMHNASSSSPTLINCTFSGNSATNLLGNGGGMYNESASPTLINCIVWGNTATNGPQIHQAGGTLTITYSNIQGGHPGVGNSDANPMFVRAPWTGPDSIFGTADDDPGDLRLRPGSPMLNAGSNAAIPAGVSTDLTGNARIQDGFVDMGAYEGTAAAPAPRTIYVDRAATAGANTGVSWSDAFTDLQFALAAAADGDVIRVADGNYLPAVFSFTPTLSFALRNAVAIYGGYAGSGAADPNARDIALYPTILMGNDRFYHILTATGVGPQTLLDGVTVTGGSANGFAWNQSNGGGLLAVLSSLTLNNCIFSGNSASAGGGIYNDRSSPTLTNCTFSGNSANGNNRQGGGIYNGSFSSPTLINCTFNGNSAIWGGGMYNAASASPTLNSCTFTSNSASWGGGMYNAASASPTLTNCVLSGNSATSGGGMYNDKSSPTLSNSVFSGNSACYGGGMYNNAASPALHNCTFSGNVVSGTDNSGGGMYNNAASSPTLTNCIFSGNSATGNNGYGGAMYSTASSPKLTDCSFSRNAARAGGGMYNDKSSPTLTNCAFSGNSAGGAYGEGGGMYNGSSSPTLTNCTFNGNRANGTYSTGGGICNASSSPILINCTFSGNAASTGGGVYSVSSSSPTFTNCILWGNAAANGPQMHQAGGTLTITHSNIQGGHPGIGNIDADPMFIRTPWAGPDGVFGTADDEPGDLRLRPGSPMLNRGSNAAVPAGVTTDLAGNDRIQDGTVDMGAYEGVAAVPAIKTFYVDAAATIGANTGASWADAFISLQSALAAAADGDIIRVADGVYKPTTTTDRTVAFVLRNAVAIYGGYAGWGAADPDARDTALYPTVLSGNIGWAATNIDNSYHVLTATGVGPRTLLDGVTVADGNANGYGPNQSFGGGLLAIFASPTLNDCTFSGNAAITTHTSTYGYGGGIYNISSSPTLTNCTFSGNSATWGGGMYNAASSSPTLINCTFSGNSANRGGGMYNAASASPTLTNCVFSGNSATSSGGGMYNQSSSPTLTSCTFSGNSARSTFDNSYGGGMYNVSSSPILTNCTFSGNSASDSGGGIYNSSSSPILTNCTLSGNTATGDGGGMYNTASSPTLTNCIFNGNSSSNYGGGMYNGSASPTLINCTFSGNTTSSGGGMYNTASSSPTLTNCIVWGNTARWGPQIYLSGGTPTITYSNIQGGYAGIGNIDVDPMFVGTSWTGPDGVFGTADDGFGDLRLRPGSPMLNAGSNAAVPAGISTDLTGNARIQGGTVDMGAYEGTVAPPLRIFYVDAAATAGANTGASWSDAFTSLQSALAAATDGDTIRIAKGTYTPTDTSDRTLSFALRNAVAIYGGYAGWGAVDPDARDIALYSTILSGDIGVVGDIADNSYHVLTATKVEARTLLDGVMVTGGNANGVGLNQSYGGGLLAILSSPMLANCTFSGNAASFGGGMYNDSSSPMLANCIFSGNSARSSIYSYGGGMYNSSSSPVLTNCTFSGNSAASGGGMYNGSSSPALINCTFNGNGAGGSGGGGGMYNDSSSPMLANCTFVGNMTEWGDGGGMYNNSSSPVLTNCTFSGNSAGYSGGMYISSSSSTTLVTLTNCILWGNSTWGDSQIVHYGGKLTVTYSNIQGGWTGVGNIDADPLFVRNPSPGPDGTWGTADDDYGNLRLRPESPCVDRGNNNAAGLAGITTDLAGRPRFVDVALTPDAGLGTPPIIDMGAYEVQWRAPAWLDPAGLAAWDFDTYSLDIGGTTLTIAADDANRPERLAAIRSYIAAARSGSAGIVSSAAAGNQWVTVTLDEQGQILVRLALIGDVTLDDRLDGDDYFALDQAFLFSGGMASPAADLNLDGRIDARDYFVLDRAFLTATANAAIEPSAAMPIAQAAQQPPANPFSTRPIAEELLQEEDSVLLMARS